MRVFNDLEIKEVLHLEKFSQLINQAASPVEIKNDKDDIRDPSNHDRTGT